jgi:hypothetical protein
MVIMFSFFLLHPSCLHMPQLSIVEQQLPIVEQLRKEMLTLNQVSKAKGANCK